MKNNNNSKIRILTVNTILLAFLLLICQSYLFAAPPQLQVSGTNFVNASTGCQVRLVGVDVDGLEWQENGEGPPNGAAGAMTQSITVAVNTWKANIVRIPLNQDFWFGYDNGVGTSSATQNTTYETNYRNYVTGVVNAASALNCYVELDLHWSGNGNWGSSTTVDQQSMPDENSVAFWQSLATTFGNNPAVMFDLYNEPFPTAWSTWENGGTSNEGFTCPGFQTLVQTVRDKGAKNVLMVGGLGYSWDMTGISANHLTDKNTGNTLTGYGIAYEAHIYDNKGGTTMTDKINLWNTNVTVAVTAGYCVIVSEFGAITTGTAGTTGECCGEDDTGCDPFESDLISWLNGSNTANYTYSGQAWDLNPYAGPILISDWNYTPTTCHGSGVQAWLAAVVQPTCGTASSPTFTPNITNTFTQAPTRTMTSTFTRTYTLTATATFTPTFTMTPTPSYTFTRTTTPSFTNTITASYTATGTYTALPTATKSNTGTYTITLTNTNTPVNTATLTATGTNTLVNTSTPTATGTNTELPTGTPTYTKTDTSTNTPVNTATPTNTNTLLPTGTTTYTKTSTYTNTPTNTVTGTNTQLPTGTNTATPTLTDSPIVSTTPTYTATIFTATITPTYTISPTITWTNTSSPTGTSTSSASSTNTVTWTPTTTSTFTITKSATSTLTLTPINTETYTDTPVNTATPTETGTYTELPTATHTSTNSPFISETPTYTATIFTATITPTCTSSPTFASTIPDTATNTASQTKTNTTTLTQTVTLTGTDTPVNTATQTLTGTVTSLPTDTFTVTDTPIVSETPTYTSTIFSATITTTFTSSLTITFTNTPENTLTNTPVDTVTLTNTPANTATDTPQNTLTQTQTITSISSFTNTPQNTAVNTATPSATPTAGVNLIASIVLSTNNAIVGQDITVIMQVVNAGTTAANNVQPSGLTETGGTAVLVSGPNPGNTTIAAGLSASFTWIYSITSATGSMTFSGYASGIDAINGIYITSPEVISSPLTCTTATPTAINPVATASFTATSTIPVIITPTPVQTVRIYPNPTKDKFKYVFMLSEDADIQMSIYTESYRLIERFDQKLSAGYQVLEIETQGFANGTYFILYRQKGQRTNLSRIDKFIVLK